jgi:predicted aspartyl protease
MATPFTTHKFPPAPILPLRLSSPGEPASSSEYQDLIDTGSDFTLVPLRYLLAINAPETRSAFVRGLFSQQQLVTLYLVDIHTDIGVFMGYEVIGIGQTDDGFEDEEIILGRNVLNRLYLFLNGPDSETQLLERRPRRF